MEKKFPNVSTDTHVVMPNHFHAIIILSDGNPPSRMEGQTYVSALTATRNLASSKPRAHTQVRP